MSKRLQVILRDDEFDQLRETAERQGLTVSEWVRQTLRRAGAEVPAGQRAHKLSVVQAGAEHSFPTSDIDEMLADIERGYVP